jgi:hypothetical protein
MISFTKDQIKIIQNLKPLTDSKFKYESTRWRNLNKDYKFLLHEFEEKEISRQDVINSFNDYFNDDTESSCLKAFLLTMVWGFANNGYGTFRTNKYISDEQNRKIIKEAMGQIDSDKPDKLKMAFLKLASINGLGISYLTKLLYFATRAKSDKYYALIFDVRVARSLVRFTSPKEIYDIINIAPSSKFIDYKNFIDLMHKQASIIEVSAEQLEMYLFEQEVVDSNLE